MAEPDLDHGLRLVKRIAADWARRVPPWVTFDDLVGAGNLGLTKALNSWNPERVPFPQYAAVIIRWEIQNYLRTGDPPGVDLDSVILATESTSDAEISERRRVETLHELLRATLNEQYQRILRLAFWEDKTVEHIAAELHLTVPMVNRYKQRAISLLRKRLGVE